MFSKLQICCHFPLASLRVTTSKSLILKNRIYSAQYIRKLCTVTSRRIYQNTTQKHRLTLFPLKIYSYSTMAVCTRYMPCELVYETNLRCCDYDGIILVSGCKPGTDEPEPFKSTLCEALEIDEALFKSGAVLPVKLPAKRLIYSPTGPLNPDYDDVRSFGEAAVSGIKRALSAGVRKPLLILLPDCRYENVELVTLLGALEALYVPLEVREISAEKACKVKTLAVWSPSCSKKIMGIMNQAIVLESGRFVARDIGGPDPERMAPPRVEEYIKQLFENSRVCVHSITDTLELLEDYPLFACVNRAASVVPRHAGRVIYMTYEPADQSCIKNTYIFIGKGVTYDTGGADIKTSLSMAGMSRDKCGAAAAIGLMQVVNLLQPSNIKVIAAIGVVRNSSGENNYVSDEVITAKSGARVRVNNTDAEGRMVMADILYHAKERACNTINPYLFTIATLTGHAKNTVGTGYSIAMDNSIARECKVAENLRLTGDLVGEPVEVSIIRREDFKTHKGRAEGDDVIQSGSSKSAKSQRGHQAPAAFLMMASGLNKHGKGSEKPLKYTHIDIAASAGELPDQPTGAPIISLSSRLFNEELKELENSGSDLITVKNKIPEN